MRLVLASASPRRADLLTAAGFEFDVQAADVDERVRLGEAPEAYARRVAEAKARVVAQRQAGRVVLAADTIVVVDGAILGKPRDAADARRMLRWLSGRWHEVMTAVTIVAGGPDAGDVARGGEAGRSEGPAEAGHYDGPAGAGHYDGPAGAGHYDGPAEAGGSEGPARAGHYDGRAEAGHYEGVARTRVEFARLTEGELDWYVASGEPLDKAGAYAIQGLASRFVTRIEGSYSNVVGLPVSLVAELLKQIEPAEPPPVPFPPPSFGGRQGAVSH